MIHFLPLIFSKNESVYCHTKFRYIYVSHSIIVKCESVIVITCDEWNNVIYLRSFKMIILIIIIQLYVSLNERRNYNNNKVTLLTALKAKQQIKLHPYVHFMNATTRKSENSLKIWNSWKGTWSQSLSWAMIKHKLYLFSFRIEWSCRKTLT